MTIQVHSQFIQFSKIIQFHWPLSCEIISFQIAATIKVHRI